VGKGRIVPFSNKNKKKRRAALPGRCRLKQAETIQFKNGRLLRRITQENMKEASGSFTVCRDE